MITLRGLTTALRDTALYAGGWLLIFKQAGILFNPPTHVSEILVLTGAAMVGVPGLVQILAARSGGGTPPSQSEPPQPELPGSSSGEPSRAGDPR